MDGPANTMKLADFDGPAADLSAGSDDRDEVDLAEARHPLQERGWGAWPVTCGFSGRAGGHGCARQIPLLTVAEPWIWHGCGTRRSAVC
jgi:hypothetical protein